MNLLFIHHDAEIQSEIDDFLKPGRHTSFFAKNTEATIRVLNDHPIDLVILIINHMRDAAILKYINDNYSNLKVLLIASDEYDEIISLFSEHHYITVRMPLKLNDLALTIEKMIPTTRTKGPRIQSSISTKPGY